MGFNILEFSFFGFIHENETVQSFDFARLWFRNINICLELVFSCRSIAQCDGAIRLIFFSFTLFGTCDTNPIYRLGKFKFDGSRSTFPLRSNAFLDAMSL